MDCSPPGSSVHGIFQARVLEWGAIAFSAKRCFQAGILMSTLPCVPYVRNMYMGVCMCSRIDVALMAMLPVPDPDFSVHVLSNFPCGSAGKESACSVGDLGSISRLGRSPGVRKGYPLQYCGLENSMDCIVHGVTKSQTWLSDFHFTSLPFLGFPGGSVVKNPPANAGDVGSSPGLGRSPGEGNGNPLQYSCLRGNLMDRGAWRATVHGVAMSQTWLSDFPFQLR